MLLTGAVTILVLGVLIFVHELGHFAAAKAVGVEVQRFSIGLGPKVLGFTHGETEYVLSAIPLGGYVKMGGMDDEVLERMEGGRIPQITPVVGPEDLIRAREVVDGVYLDDRVKAYILDLVFATRSPADFGLDLAGLIRYGGSPRATLFLARAAKAHAFLGGRAFVIPEDVKSVGFDVLRHRKRDPYRRSERHGLQERRGHPVPQLGVWGRMLPLGDRFHLLVDEHGRMLHRRRR